MSSTRYAKPGSPLSQGRFASSPALNNGLRGNLVALRCATIDSREDRELVLALQQISYRGGLKKFAADMIAAFPEHVATPSLFALSAKPEKSLTAEQVRKIRRELPAELNNFPLAGDSDEADDLLTAIGYQSTASRIAIREAADAECDRIRKIWVDKRPTSYPAEVFYKLCQFAASEQLECDLKELCLDPDVNIKGLFLWYFHDVISTLRDYLVKVYNARLAGMGFANTALNRAIWSAIDDTYEMGGTVLLHNSAGNGKSFAAKSYCEAHPGRGRCVLTPTTNLEIDFWRAIADALGTADGLSYKCEQIRTRAKGALLGSGLVLVIDSAQFLFPVADYRYALPNRLNQVLELAELGVPIVLIADSKIFDTLGFVEARTGWNRNKFVNQVRVVELPATLEKEDVIAVAAALLPDGDRAAQRKLADYMIVAPGYLHSGEVAAKRARRIAKSNRRESITLADMEEALESSLTAGLRAIETGLKRADAAAAKCKAKGRNWRPETPAQLAAKSGKRRNQIVTSSDMNRPAMPPQAGDAEVAETDFRRSGTNRIVTPDAVTSRRHTAPDLVTA